MNTLKRCGKYFNDVSAVTTENVLFQFGFNEPFFFLSFFIRIVLIKNWTCISCKYQPNQLWPSL